ncbi:hypothetical protein M5D96_013321 [Drosophila gunungcola]|uniref:Uncharacterized protein n=1 Tax=Drosophila gunungcola TaxID=103775 RepID=A0A9Q0BJP3_9MUSC|nr:hypothetical protein M5D96_013321 [Drosophila gunungcola]
MQWHVYIQQLSHDCRLFPLHKARVRRSGKREGERNIIIKKKLEKKSCQTWPKHENCNGQRNTKLATPRN